MKLAPLQLFIFYAGMSSTVHTLRASYTPVPAGRLWCPPPDVRRRLVPTRSLLVVRYKGLPSVAVCLHEHPLPQEVDTERRRHTQGKRLVIYTVHPPIKPFLSRARLCQPNTVTPLKAPVLPDVQRNSE